jgi:hypothetical protein
VSDRVKRLLVVVVGVLAATAVAAIGVEMWVRMTWDVRRGTPGFYVPDAVRGARLSENYSGWFAGVPVHINSLGLRDPREYDLQKTRNTFRILVLGDSVTFGHGSIYEHTYPYLLEQQLKAWRPGVDWQVWNASVPGYNTSQELAHLLEVGPRFKPDLVVVGFYENDLLDNHTAPTPSRVRRAVTALAAVARRHVWSLEFYRRVYYTVAWRITAPTLYNRRLETLARDEAAEPHDATRLPAQQLTRFARLSDREVADTTCVDGNRAPPDLPEQLRRDPGFGPWLDAVRGFQALDRAKAYRIVFFVNVVPRKCYDGDFFYDGATRLFNDFMVRILGDSTDAVSCHDAFLHVRPSEMPNADGHALGNSNQVKADVLFGYLRDRVLPRTQAPALRVRAPA